MIKKLNSNNRILDETGGASSAAGVGANHFAVLQQN